MSPFAPAQPKLKPSPSGRLFARRTPLTFALCLVVGLGVVVWRAKSRIDAAFALARTEAQARGALLELQLSQASTAAEVLGTLARQGRGGLTNFQKVAKELLTAHPGIVSLELQPGGVVSEVVPREGHERAIGFNVLKDAGQRLGANEAIARRALTFAAPVTLDHGEPGIVARVPVFQRTLEGRDSFWGFVAVSMRLHEALSRSRVDDRLRQDYNFALFTLPPTGQTGVTLASQGWSSLQHAIQQPVRAQNLEFRLALKPRGGWIDKTTLVLESVAMLLISAIMAFAVNLMESRRALEADLAEANQRLNRRIADQEQGQAYARGATERLASVQTENQQAQLALQQAEAKAAQLQTQLDAVIREREEAAQVEVLKLKESQAALETAQGTIAQMQLRQDALIQTEKDAALAEQERLRQNQAALAELQVRLEAAVRSAQDAAQTSAASQARLEQSNRELKKRLVLADGAEARVTELSRLLQTAQEELCLRQKARPASPSPKEPEDGALAPGDEPSSEGQPCADLSGAPSPAPLTADEPAPIANGNGGLDSAEPVTLTAPPAPSPEINTESSAPPPPTEATVEAVSLAEPAPTHLAAKAPRRKKPRRDNQMDLFGAGATAVPATEPLPSQPASGEGSPALAVIEGHADADDCPKQELQALQQFAEEHADAPEKIRQGLLQGELPEAQRVMQALKSAASSIGATAVHKAITALAHACHEGSDPSEIELLWAELDKELRELRAGVKLIAPAREEKPPASRRLPAAPPVDPAQLRKAVNQIVPLLADGDPGAKDCLRDNRTTFRSTFTPESYAEFEQLVKGGEFEPALEQLKKAARKHGIAL